MTTLPAQMIDRWRDRAEPGPDEGDVYWHILMNDHPQVVDLARQAQQRLTRFPGLHMTPLERLHMTALPAGPADHFSQDQLQQMVKIAATMLADTPPITVTVGSVLYHPEAIMFDVKPKRALASIHDAVQAATQAVTGSLDPDSGSPRWIPHVTVCYSTADQAMAPIIAALGPQQQECQIQISTISLVIQRGPERLGIGARSEPSTSRRLYRRGPKQPDSHQARPGPGRLAENSRAHGTAPSRRVAELSHI